MANNIFCSELNQLADFALIAGTPETLEFFFYMNDGTPIDLSQATAKWRLCYLGQYDYSVAEIAGEIFDGNGVVVKLTTADTANLSGKYIQQPVLIDVTGQEYIYQQGIVTILPKIQPIN